MVDIVAYCVFGGDPVLVKRIPVIPKITFNNNEHIVLLSSKNFYILSINDGTVENYQMLLSNIHEKIEKINYSSRFGWIVLVGGRNNCKEIYRLVLDNYSKTIDAHFVTNCPTELFNPLCFTVGEKEAFMIYRECNILHIFSFEENTWSKKVLRRPPPDEQYNVISATDEGRNIMVLHCEEMEDAGDEISYTVAKLVGDCWRRLPVDFYSLENKTAELSMMHSKNGLVFYNDDYVNGYVAFVNVNNPLSLQDIAMKKILECWNDLEGCMPFKTFLDGLNLPIFMKRQYFGLAWMWKEEVVAYNSFIFRLFPTRSGLTEI